MIGTCVICSCVASPLVGAISPFPARSDARSKGVSSVGCENCGDERDCWILSCDTNRNNREDSEINPAPKNRMVNCLCVNPP